MLTKVFAPIALGLCITWAFLPALSADEKAAVPELLGSWVNVDTETRSYGQIDLVDEDGTIFLELWAIQGGKLSDEPVAKLKMPIDAETLRIPPLVGVSADTDYGFKEETYTIKRKGKELQLTWEAFFKDGTNRNKRLVERFRKKTS